MNHPEKARHCEESATKQSGRGDDLAANATIDKILPFALIAWLCALCLDTAGPMSLPWPNLYDLAGLAIMGTIIARNSTHLLARPAMLVTVALFFWLIARTPALQANTQVAHALLMLFAFTSALALRNTAWHAVLLVFGGTMLLTTVVAEFTGHGAWLSDHWNIEPQLAGGWRRWAGPTAHPNLLAYLCAIVLWAGLSFNWRGRRWAIPAALILGTGIGICLFGTLSRSGWLLAGATCAGGALWLRLRSQRATLPALLLLATTIGAFGGMAIARPDLFAERYKSVQRQVSPTPKSLLGMPEVDILSRGNVYRDTVHLIRESPILGHGLAAYERLGKYDALHSHQMALELLLIGGIPALLVVFGGLFWALWRGQGVFLRGFLLLALASGLTDMIFFFKWPAVWLAFTLGLALHHAKAPSLPKWPQLPVLRRHGAVIALFLAMAFAFQFREEYSIDFHAYYGAMRWSAETGEPPYLDWTGHVFGTGDDKLSQYLMAHQTESSTYALQFLYPPTAFLQLRAFTWIDDPDTAVRLWRVFNLAALAGCIITALQFLPRGMRANAALLLCLLTASYAPVRDTFWLGQVSVWVSCLMLACFLALHRRHAALAGFTLALAAALKIYPAFWAIAVLMYPGQRIRFSIAFGATLAAMAALSLAVDGAAVWQSYWDNVLSKMGDTPPPGGVTLYPFFGDREAMATSSALAWTNRLALLAVIGVASTVLWRLRRAGTDRKFRGLIAATALLFLSLPLVWAHYLVLLGALLATGALRWIPAGLKRAPIGASLLGLAYLLTGQMWIAEAIVGAREANYAQAGLLCAAAGPLVMVAEIAVHRRRSHRPVASP